MMPGADPRILVACVGNIFLGDDGFGVEVARRFVQRAVPPGVTVKDFGIRGFDLAYALMDPYDFVILVDACPRGGEAGSVYVIDPDLAEAGEDGAVPGMEGHSMNPMSVVRLVMSMGGTLPPMRIVGCEPADLGPVEEGKLGLSHAVEAAVDEAVLLIEKLLADIDGVFVEQGHAVAVSHSH
jgi:hydrogenase maturation protease